MTRILAERNGCVITGNSSPSITAHSLSRIRSVLSKSSPFFKKAFFGSQDHKRPVGWGVWWFVRAWGMCLGVWVGMSS